MAPDTAARGAGAPTATGDWFGLAGWGARTVAHLFLAEICPRQSHRGSRHLNRLRDGLRQSFPDEREVEREPDDREPAKRLPKTGDAATSVSIERDDRSRAWQAARDQIAQHGARTSMKHWPCAVRLPSAWIAFSISAKRTGLTICVARVVRAAAASRG